MVSAAGGGASGVSRQLLLELASRELEIDCYLAGSWAAVPEELKKQANLRFICQKSSWEWNRWYSRNNFLAFVTGQAANLRTENRLARELLQRHRLQPYDLIYQFSHIELSSLRRYKKYLPPIVIHPSVHAHGELRWHKKEAELSKRTEKWLVRLGVRTLLTARSMVQRRHIQLPERVLALSQNFAQDLISDYGLSPSAIDIVPNPVDLQMFHPVSSHLQATAERSRRRTVILFASRIAVRKGVEQIVELSHRLDDLAENIEIQVVGNKSLWSDYMGLLQAMNQRTARYLGAVSYREIAELYRNADMLVQPSKYEPFGLTVGEALASGVPVVTSDKVGAVESVNPMCCRTFSSNDMGAFENEVRKLLHDLSDKTLKHDISKLARAESERLYASSVVGDLLLRSFRQLVDGQTNAVEARTGLEFGGSL